MKTNFTNFVIIFLLTLLIMPTVLSFEAAYKFPKGQSIDIKNPCFNNGTYCTALAECRITVYDPLNQLIVNNE